MDVYYLFLKCSCEIFRIINMDLETALLESKQAIHLFFNNDFEGAKKIMEPWANSSMYHALGNSVFTFLEAILTFEQVCSLFNKEIRINQAVRMFS